MSEMFDTSQWLAFFTKAGLPPNVAANYALIFSDNRIQLDMLMDLSKEYLYDMGIRVMGDVIAILRFAKEFHTQMAKDRAIGNSVVLPHKVVGRMVDHYTRSRLSPKQSPVKIHPQVIPSKSNIISLKRSASEEIPVTKRVRRVPPEEEGAYKIKMPSGTTERTRKILQKQQNMSGSKRSVFSRLGDSAVSSSTDSAKPKPSSSVFERLGPSNKSSSDDVPTSTVLGPINKVKRMTQPLQYQGVLKITSGEKRIISSGYMPNRTVIKPMFQGVKPPTKVWSQGLKSPSKVISLKRINNILESSSNGSQGIFSRLKAPPKVGIQGRLGGPKIDVRNLTRTKILMQTQKSLGKKNTSNVFDRLGK